MNEVARIDHDVIKMMAGMTANGGPDFLTTLISMYMETTPAHLDTLKRAAASDDVNKLRRVSHDLKSSSAALGAIALSAYCAELEALTRGGSTGGALALVSRIVEEFGAVRPELEAWLRAPA